MKTICVAAEGFKSLIVTGEMKPLEIREFILKDQYREYLKVENNYNETTFDDDFDQLQISFAPFMRYDDAKTIINMLEKSLEVYPNLPKF